MPWAKFDDKVIRSRKVRRVARKDPSAALLWMFAIIYCCEQMTDGEIEGDDEPNLAALREAARQHSDTFIVKTDLEDADQREATPGMREQP